MVPAPDSPDDTTPPRLLKTTEAAALVRCDRRLLDRLATRYPDEPGGPMVVGGTRRVHRRWPPQTIVSWFARVTARQGAVAASPAAAASPTASPDTAAGGAP
jgi:hypothetical protein